MPDLAARFRPDKSMYMAVAAVDDVGGVLASAEREVLVMGASGDALGLAQQVVLRRGIRYRVVFPSHVCHSPATEARLADLTRSGALVRMALRVPVDTLVVDKALVVFPHRRTAGGAMVVELPSIVAATNELFERTWAGGAPFAARRAGRAHGLDAREREVLRGLSEGWSDERVAAQLGVSVRTVRREIARLMNRLDARSRFQAGVRAAARGWLEALAPGVDESSPETP